MKKVKGKVKLIQINEDNLYFGGVCGVDAGIIFIGDPCYHLHKSVNADGHNKLPQAFGTNWSDFVNKTLLSNDNALQFNYDLGHAGLGILIQGFGGDGCYPVYVELDEEGQTKRVVIDFQCE